MPTCLLNRDLGLQFQPMTQGCEPYGKKEVSSANIFKSEFNPIDKSLMYIKKNNGQAFTFSH